MKTMLALFAILASAANGVRADDDFREFKGHTGPTRVGLFTPDGKTLVSCSGWPGGDGTIRVWDVKSGKELRKMTGHKANIDDMTISPDGKRVYSGAGSQEGVVRGWEVETGKEVVKFEGHTKGQNISCVIVAPDGKSAASGGSNKKLFIWNTADGKLIRELTGHTDLVRCVAFTPNGKKLCSGSWDGSVKVWDTATGKEMISFKPKTKWVEGLAMIPDGKRLLVASQELAMWDIETGEKIKSFKGHPGATCIHVNADGKKMITGWYDGKVMLWDVENGAKEAEYQAHVGNVHGVRFSPDGKWFSTAGGGSYENGKDVKGTDFILRLWKFDE
jgi:WD40 repeat protein